MEVRTVPYVADRFLVMSESDRLQALRVYSILDTAPEEALDDLARLAALICRTPIALVNMVDADRVWSKSNIGFLAKEVARTNSFCDVAVKRKGVLTVSDSLEDRRFSHLPMVASDPRIRFYAGAPLLDPTGLAIGTLCVMDREPRQLSHDQLAALQTLARQVMTKLELRRNLTKAASSAEEQRRMTEALGIAEAKYRSLVETAPAVVYLDELDDASSTLYISPQIHQLLGYTPEEWIADPGLWVRILHPADRGRATADQEEVYRAGAPWNEEYRMIARDGRVVWVHDLAVLVRDEAGRPLGWQGIWLDITPRKTAEEGLHEALVRERAAVEHLSHLDEVKNMLLHAVSHDLRAPITTMLASAITLERDEQSLSPKERLELVRGLASSARRMHRIVTDLLDMDRLDQGIVTPARHMTDVGALAARVVEELGFVAERPVSVVAAPVTVAVDGSKVERIVENLLANASRHTPPGTQIWVRVEPYDLGVLIVVEDAGRGVPPDMRRTVFEPFQQGSPGEGPGLGMGLSLVARFAQLHGGRAWVEDRPGGGASFRVYLPDGPVDEDAAAERLGLGEPPQPGN